MVDTIKCFLEIQIKIRMAISSLSRAFRIVLIKSRMQFKWNAYSYSPTHIYSITVFLFKTSSSLYYIELPKILENINNSDIGR